MPTTGRTAARNYRDRRTLTSSSDSDTTPERSHPKPLSQAQRMKRQHSRSRSPHRSYPPQRQHSPIGHRTMKPAVRGKLRMLPHSLKPGGPLPLKRAHSPRRSDFSPPRKSSHHGMGDYERPRNSKREPDYANRKHLSKDPPERKRHVDSPPSRPPPERETHGKFRMEEHYRGGGQGDYRMPSRENESLRIAKGDMDMRDRDIIIPQDFSHKDRPQRGRESMQPMSGPSPSFLSEKKDHPLLRDEGYSRGETIRSRSPPSDHLGVSTLDERFRHSTEKPPDTRMLFDRQELEKITIDIRRSVREPSPTVRRIANPEEIKVVRRQGEGVRPLFEREEIKKPLVDLREDASFERRVSIAKRDAGDENDYRKLCEDSGEMRSGGGRNYVDVSGSTLSDRWQSVDRKQNVQMFRSRRDMSEDRGHSHKQGGSPIGFREREREFRASSINKNIDRDFSRDDQLFDRELHGNESRGSMDDRRDDDNREFHRPYLDDPGDLRYNLARRKDGSFSDDQHFSERSSRQRRDSKGSGSWRDSSGKNALDISSGRYRDSRSRQRSRSPSHDRERRDSSREERVDFSQRPDRFKYAPWAEKPEVIPKGPSYYEHDDRGENGLNRRRFRGRIFRPRGFRGRVMRGGSTRGNFGNFRGRIFRGNLSRGRPFIRRSSGGRSSSPRHWEHDLFNKMSPDKSVRSHD